MSPLELYIRLTTLSSDGADLATLRPVALAFAAALAKILPPVFVTGSPFALGYYVTDDWTAGGLRSGVLAHGDIGVLDESASDEAVARLCSDLLKSGMFSHIVQFVDDSHALYPGEAHRMREQLGLPYGGFRMASSREP